MTLPFTEFERQCRVLAGAAEGALSCAWVPVASKYGPPSGYLVLKECRVVAATSPALGDPEVDDALTLTARHDAAESESEDEEAVQAVAQPEGRALSLEAHVVHSPAFQNPVLYFTACDDRGEPLSAARAWYLVDSAHHAGLHDGDHPLLTQHEHPLLRRPFFQLHPCRTAELMRAVASVPGQGDGEGPRNPLHVLSWLSLVSPVLGLALPPAWIRLAHQPRRPRPASPL